MAFLEELREHENPGKRNMIKRWKKISSAKSVEEEPYYAYLNKFKVKGIPYKVPEEISGDFDWQLLFQLVAASFSSEYELTYPNLDNTDEVISENELPELRITVHSGNSTVTKNVSDLYAFTTLRLYEIYLEEQINLHVFKCEDKNEKNTIDAEREIRLTKFNQLKAAYLKYKKDLKQRNIRQDILND